MYCEVLNIVRNKIMTIIVQKTKRNGRHTAVEFLVTNKVV